MIHKPIKRSKELVYLSRDHHDGLLLCWKIRTGLRNNIQPERIAAYVIDYMHNELEEHFREEEFYVYPLLPKTDKLIQLAISQHSSLRVRVLQLSGNRTDTALLTAIAEELDEHIRYEERELFPYIEQNARAGSIQKAGTALENLHENKKKHQWQDEFWNEKT